MRVAVVGDNTKVNHLRASRGGDSGDAKTVGGNDLIRPGSAAWRDQFIAGCDDRNDGPSHDVERGMVGRRGKRQCCGIERASIVEQRVSLDEIKAAPADMAAGGDGFENIDRIV